jgi:hypothetical protein
MLVLTFGCFVTLGFLAGLFSFRIKSRWCPNCGSTTACYGPSDQEPSRRAA